MLTFFRHDDTIYKPHIERQLLKMQVLPVIISVAANSTLYYVHDFLTEIGTLYYAHDF